MTKNEKKNVFSSLPIILAVIVWIGAPDGEKREWVEKDK